MSVVRRGASDTTGCSKEFVIGSMLFYRYLNIWISDIMVGKNLTLRYLRGLIMLPTIADSIIRVSSADGRGPSFCTYVFMYQLHDSTLED